MTRTMTETQVLKKLNIEDFRYLTKDKVMTMATMLDKMDPEVAKKALEQFPSFASTMKEILAENKKTLDEGLRLNEEGVNAYYESCDAIITVCQKELQKENLSFEEKSFLLGQMVEITKMKGEKNSEDKRFIISMSLIGLAAVGFTASALLAVLGGNVKIDTDKLLK